MNCSDMNLSAKYDRFYSSDLKTERFSEIHIQRFPHNRYEAIIAVGGQGETILDIGCGNGFLLWQFRKKFDCLIGLEYSEQRLEQAKINLRGTNFHAVLGSAEDLNNIKTESVDLIISADTIEHVPDVYAATAEMYRVLKPTGKLVINTPNVAFIKKRLLLIAGRFPSTSQPSEGVTDSELFDGGHLHYFTFRSLRLLLERANFRMVKKNGFGKLSILQFFFPNLLSSGVQWIAVK